MISLIYIPRLFVVGKVKYEFAVMYYYVFACSAVRFDFIAVGFAFAAVELVLRQLD